MGDFFEEPKWQRRSVKSQTSGSEITKAVQKRLGDAGALDNRAFRHRSLAQSSAAIRREAPRCLLHLVPAVSGLAKQLRSQLVAGRPPPAIFGCIANA